MGIFSSEHSFALQLLGVAAYGAASFISAFAIFAVLKATAGIRVTRDEELKGLDIAEHGMESYSGFQIFRNQ